MTQQTVSLLKNAARYEQHIKLMAELTKEIDEKKEQYSKQSTILKEKEELLRRYKNGELNEKERNDFINLIKESAKQQTQKWDKAKSLQDVNFEQDDTIVTNPTKSHRQVLSTISFAQLPHPYFKIKILQKAKVGFNCGIGTIGQKQDEFLGLNNSSWGFNLNGLLFHNGE